MRVVALGSSLAACATSTDGKWEKADMNPATLQKDDAECLTAAGLERAPQVYAGTAGVLGREGDSTGRGYPAYVGCMEAKGYTRSAR